MKTTWFEEYIKLRDEFAGEKGFERKIANECKEKKIKYRTTILALGIWCVDNVENNARKWVQRWLQNAGRDMLTRRSQFDALFIFSYEALKNVPLEERENIFIGYVEEYSNWVKDKSFFDDKISSRNMLLPDVVTFGDLYKRVEHASVTSKNGTMRPKTTDIDSMNKLNEILKEKKSLSDFLDYLSKDETITDYNKKSSFYMQKMLYDIIKRGVDVLCNHNLGLDADTEAEYDKTRKFALEQGGNTIKRYLKYNGFYIKSPSKTAVAEKAKITDKSSKAIEFGEWVVKNKNSLKPAKCLEKLQNYEINYSGIFSALYEFLVGEKFGYIDNIITSEVYDYDDATAISIGMHYSIFDEKGCFKRDVPRDLKRWLSGNKYVNRELLAVFGAFAGYNKEKMNKCLRKSGLDEFDPTTGFDNAILQILKSDTRKKIEKVANSKKYIDIKHETFGNRSPQSYIGYIGEAERKEYTANIHEISEIFEDNIADTDQSLALIFDGDLVKKTIDELGGCDLRKLKKIGGK